MNRNTENIRPGFGLLSLSIIMDLCWLNAWGLSLISATTKLIFPFGIFCTLFVAGYTTSILFRKSNIRRIWTVLSHILGFAIMAAGSLYYAGITAYPQTLAQWYAGFLITICTIVFWYRGSILAQKSLDYQFICRHFDLGISLIFTLYLINLLVEIKGGTTISVPACYYLMLLFFLAGPAALFTSFHPKKSDGQYIEGYKGYGIFISAALIIMSACLIWGLIFHPLLTQMAQSGTAALQNAARPLAPYFIAFLRFLFAPRTQSDFKQTAKGNADIFQGSGNHHSADSPGNEIMINLLLTALLLFALFILGFILYKVFQWLMKKHPQTNKVYGQSLFFKNILIRLQRMLKVVKILIHNLTCRTENAVEGFLQLSSWGRRSGVPKQNNETPSEYCFRLSTHFKILANEIKTVQQAFLKEVYAKKKISQRDLNRVNAALKRMRLPSFWGMRMKSLFFNDRLTQIEKEII